jgi:hypothetical protein
MSKKGRVVATDRHKAVAKAYVRDRKTLKDAMIAGGYTEVQANKGLPEVAKRAGLSLAIMQEVRALMAEDPRKLESPEWRALWDLRAVDNLLKGEDKAVGTMKLVAQLKENRFTDPDVVVGIFANQAPRELEDRGSPPLLEGEVVE